MGAERSGRHTSTSVFVTSRLCRRVARLSWRQAAIRKTSRRLADASPTPPPPPLCRRQRAPQSESETHLNSPNLYKHVNDTSLRYMYSIHNTHMPSLTATFNWIRYLAKLISFKACRKKMHWRIKFTQLVQCSSVARQAWQYSMRLLIEKCVKQVN